MNKQLITDDVSLVLTGSAGQGIKTIEYLLTKCLKLSGYHIFSSKEYMSRIRGGMNSLEIRISSKRRRSYVHSIDLLFPLEAGGIEHLGDRISKNTVIAGDFAPDSKSASYINISFEDIAKEHGGRLYKNSIIAGFIAGIFNVDLKILHTLQESYFEKKGKEITDKNKLAVSFGYEYSNFYRDEFPITEGLIPNKEFANDILIDGAEAVALGAIAGGCNFIGSYPMSPSTGVFTHLATYSHQFPIIVEQAEDEISAINMALGAWYAGARAMVSTSGGGFALMTEGISLAGMIESPVVIHLAQRPGPATGLPTRTEQGDLNLALYAGHGEFPRIILAPGSAEEAFELTHKAFYMADKFQVPVIIMTDQYLVDSLSCVKTISFENIQNRSVIVETGEEYKRYKLSDSPISPRGIPGFGNGLVRVDSDEHTEEGCITESMDMRTKMMDKRLAKTDLILAESIPPVVQGRGDSEGGSVAIVTWGSNYHIVAEAVESIGGPSIMSVHLPQIYPVPQEVLNILDSAKKCMVVENNATGQLANLLTIEGCTISERINKYDGLPFSVEEVKRAIIERMGDTDGK